MARIGLLQMTSGIDPAVNAATLVDEIGAAAGAGMLFTQEMSGLIDRDRTRGAASIVAEGARDRVRGKAVVLIDDVHASGATSAACTRALLVAGARSVTILCWARVLPDAES